MKDFIINLYANENFPIYLGCVIITLLIAFFIIFFLGKKDKKIIEQTQKLEAIKADAFSEVPTETPVEVPVSEETAPVVEEQHEFETITLPDVQAPVEAPAAPVEPTPMPEAPVVPEPVAPETPAQEMVTPPVVETPAVEMPQVETPVVQETAIESVQLDEISAPVVESTPEVVQDNVVENNLNRFDTLASSIENELNELEKQQELAKPLLNEESESIVIETPAAEVKEEPKPTQRLDVYSSVYAPKKEEPVFEETMAIELPKLKDKE